MAARYRPSRWRRSTPGSPPPSLGARSTCRRCGTGCSSRGSLPITARTGSPRSRRLPGGESLEWCYGCGKCTPVCPVDMVGEYGPRKIHRKVQTGTDLFAVAGPVALHRVWELCAGLPEAGRHDRDHAGRPRGRTEQRGRSGRAAGRLREDLPATAMPWARTSVGGRNGQRAPAFLCESSRATRLLSTCSSTWRTTGASTLGARTPPAAFARVADGPRDRLGDPRSRGEDARRLAKARRREGPVRLAHRGSHRDPCQIPSSDGS